jgi:two-component system sensor histidine kinase TctE
MQETDPQALHDRLQKVHIGAQRSAHLVHQLLSLARTETDVTLQRVDVAALAREVAREWTPKAVASGIDLGFEGEEHLHLAGDKLLLREALNNLIDNALRYCPRDCSVTLRVGRGPNPLAWVEVEDTGLGVKESDRPKLFERFWRASELPGGCGLGLAIVAEIAQRHAGSVQAIPTQPHGLTIRLEFPLT